MQLAEACRPVPGTALAEVYKIWDIPVGHSMVTEMDLRAIKIAIPGYSLGPREFRLMIYIKHEQTGNIVNLDPKTQHVERSALILCDLIPANVWIDDKDVSFPARLSDETHLTLCHTWLKALKEAIDERKNRLEN